MLSGEEVMSRTVRWIAVAWLIACRPPPDGTEREDEDRDTGEWTLEEPPPEAELRLATFNIDWLWDSYNTSYVPRNATDYGVIAQLLLDNDVDLWALQEINGESALDLLDLPEGYAYVTGDSGWSQNVAMVYRSDVVYVGNVREIDLPGTSSSSRDPLVADVRLKGTDWTFTMVSVHHKAFSDSESAAYREDQAAALYEWLDGVEGSVIAAGDFNDTFDGINSSFRSLAVFEDDEDWVFTTKDTDDYTELSYRSQIDHILLRGDVVSRYEGDCAAFPHESTSPYSNYDGGFGGDQNISSHRPLWADLDISGLAASR